MEHALIGGIVNDLPIEKMVAAPLMASIKAQSDMSMALANFVDKVGLDENGNVRMVTFNYTEKSIDAQGKPVEKERYMEAPFLALTGIPNLAVEDVNVSFELNVSTAEDSTNKIDSSATLNSDYNSWWSPVTAKFTGSVTHSSSQTRHTDTRAKYSFNVSARRQGPPEALMRIIDTITNSSATPIPEKKERKLLPKDKSNTTGATT